MVWSDDISFEAYDKKCRDWYSNPEHFIGDPPIDAQFALDLIFKTLIDSKEKYSYLTTFPQTTEQCNSIMLHLILEKYSRKYRKHLKEVHSK